MSGLRSMGQRGKLSSRKLQTHEASAKECSFITIRGTQALNFSLMECKSHQLRLMQCFHHWETLSAHMCIFFLLFMFMLIEMH